MIMVHISSLPGDVIEMALGYLFPHERNKVALASKMLNARARAILQTVSFLGYVGGAVLQKFKEHFPARVRQIKIEEWSCKDLNEFLKGIVAPRLEVLRLQYLQGTEEEELELRGLLTHLSLLRVVDIYHSSITGKCIPPQVSSLNLCFCSQVRELVVPPGTCQLDVSYSENITQIRGLSNVKLLRKDGVEVPLHDFTGKVYTFGDIVNDPEHKLLEEGANPNATNAHGSTGLAYLMGFPLENSHEVVIKHGADINAKEAGNRVVNRANYYKRYSIALMLVRRGARYCFPSWAYLKDCVDRRDYEGITLLLEKGANPNYSLKEALLIKDQVMVRLLLENRADPNYCFDIRQSKGWNQARPLHLALDLRDGAMARLLVEFRADLNAKNGAGETPLHWAVLSSMDDSENIAFLIEKGAFVDEKDNWGHTPLYFAVDNRFAKVAAFLFSKRADPYLLCNFTGLTPYSLAEQTGQMALVSLFKKRKS